MTSPAEPEAARSAAIPAPILVAAGLGTLLNPLNSSMMAVALISLHNDFGITVITATWAVSAFYLAACVGQPLMGRIGDRFGPKWVFVAGMTLVALTSIGALVADSFGTLLLIRVLLAFGTSVAYPCAVAIIQASSRGSGIPTGALGTISITNSVSAALGPAIGGVLVALGGWQGIFWINIPLSLAAIICAVRWFPGRHAVECRPRVGLVRSLDLPGVLLFAAALVGLLLVLLSIRTGLILWPLVPAVPAGVLFVIRELRAAVPFLDLRMLTGAGRLAGVYLQFIVVNLVYYGAFYGLPQWLEQVRGLTPDQAGLLLLPTAACGAIVTPLVSRMIRIRGTRPPLIIGSVVLVIGSAGLILVGDRIGLIFVVGIAVLLGIPGGFNNLGLQAAMYAAAPRGRAGIASGLFQTARYVGAILSTSMLGIVLGQQISSAGMRHVAIVMTALSAVLVAVCVLPRRPGATLS